jgi:superfamily II DNA or RNA helicase/HKD family nuclease
MASARRPASGLYDQPITTELEASLGELADELREVVPLVASDAPRQLARLFHDRLIHALSSLPSDGKLEHQLKLTNKLFQLVASEAPEGGANERIAEPGRRLLAVRDAARTGLGTAVSPVRPLIPLSSSDLIVNGHHDIALGPEVRREIASADQVDLLCSFLKWSGLRLVRDELDELIKRGKKLRVLTTAYMSTTEPRALDELEKLGAEVRVSYDTTKTRLHAKAWLFHRESGFSTGCIGSSNLSAAAMLDGLEWNVRLSARDNRPILDKFYATFEQYWADPEFCKYDREQFHRAVTQQRREAGRHFFVVDVLPRPHQQQMLDDLASEREAGHFRNLVVAATGTGKTIVAALDYRRLRQQDPKNDKLLFVAHRREILEQSLDAFRAVLRDASFGELLVGGERPNRGTHVFASIQSLKDARLDAIKPTDFDVVIVDEFHHAAADTYEQLLARLKPRVLLGLTATPERTDGKSVLHHFDGRIASELRLWQALDQSLLSPFHYFGVGGAPDLSRVDFTRGRYDAAALSNVYTADHFFAIRVRQELERRVRDVTQIRALGFCVDVRHAELMAAEFTRNGLASRAVSADSKDAERDDALRALERGDIRCVFSVDLFNEGVDLPDVDTVLFLRPTESATVFLQQLGRGLRKSEKKDCLTVLDFIGNASRKFRFDLRYRAIVGGTRHGVIQQIEDGFPSLPSGCVIELDKQSQEAVLENVRSALGLGRKALVEDLQALGPQATLRAFLRETNLELEDLYASDWSFAKLRRAAGYDSVEPDERSRQVERALGRMLHLDDRLRLAMLRQLLEQPTAPRANPAELAQRWLFILLGNARSPYSDMRETWRHLWANESLRREVIGVLDELEGRNRKLTLAPDDALARTGLAVHATYSRDEVMAALDQRAKSGGVKQPREGLVQIKELNLDLFFVTLEKSEDDYTPSTLYDDYPISPSRFHWQSQSAAHEETTTGRRHIATGIKVGQPQALLFVRQRIKDDRGETMPYVNLGRVSYLKHEGGRPMSIEWALEHEMPAWLYQETKPAAG